MTEKQFFGFPFFSLLKINQVGILRKNKHDFFSCETSSFRNIKNFQKTIIFLTGSFIAVLFSILIPNLGSF
jgi:hypothetical protein